jgi:4-alpha-glucanotransferase
MNLQFYLRFHTRFGESLWISGNTEELGMNDPKKAVAMEYLNDEFWHSAIEIHRKNWPKSGVNYKYYLKGKEGQLIGEWGFDRVAANENKDASEIQLIDTWNHAGEFENAFFTAPFKNVLLKHSHPKSNHKAARHNSHTFKIKAPLLSKHEVVCISGSGESLGNWSKQNVIQLSKEDDGGR